MKKSLLLKTVSALAVAAAFPLSALAESDYNASGSGDVSADLQFRIVIPRVLFLGVGTGFDADPLASDGTVDTVEFDFSTNPEDVGGGAGALAGSITNDGEVNVRVFGNNGQITLAANNPGTLDRVGGGDSIPLSQITVTSSNAALAAPAFGGTSQPTLTGRVTDQTAVWTYAYTNTVTPSAGDYEAVVTYTASMP